MSQRSEIAKCQMILKPVYGLFYHSIAGKSDGDKKKSYIDSIGPLRQMKMSPEYYLVMNRRQKAGPQYKQCH